MQLEAAQLDVQNKCITGKLPLLGSATGLTKLFEFVRIVSAIIPLSAIASGHLPEAVLHLQH